MIAINPDEILVQDSGTEFERTNADVLTDEEIDRLKGAVSIHQSWEMTIPEAGGTAYIRISPELRDFFKLCQEKHGVIGFDYDFEEGGLNFGLVLKKEAKQ